MNRKHRFLLAFLVCMLLAAPLAGAALAQSGRPHHVENGSISGEGYRLAAAAWQVSGTAAGGTYRLLAPTPSRAAGSGCCCSYLPCVMRGHQARSRSPR